MRLYPRRAMLKAGAFRLTPHPEPEAAVVILHALQPEESILLIRRATNPRDPWSGHWSFPGGRRDPEDRDLLDTALRELREECDITLTRETLSATLPPASAGRRVGRRILVAPFGFRVERRLPATVQPAEAVESLWAPVSMLADLSRHQRMPVPGLPPELMWPAIPLNNVPLWGFTYRLLCDWLGLQRTEDD